MTKPARGATTSTILSEAKEQRQHMTVAEMLLWERLRDRRLGGIKFRRQHPYGRFILDFYAVRFRLAVEVNGGVHKRPDQAKYDNDRTLALNDLGVRVIRFTNHAIETDIDQVLSQIIKACTPGSLSTPADC